MSELTVRERILRQLKADFETMGTDYPFEWSVVSREDLDSREYGKRYTLAILDTTETKEPRIGFMDCNLTVVFQWTGSFDADDSPAQEANEVLGAIQRKLRENWHVVEDATGEQLAVETRETANTIDIADARERMIGGTVSIVVQYRHNRDDPRSLRAC